jgi:RimJ/RimL family protein N-acetyltransferase
MKTLQIRLLVEEDAGRFAELLASDDEAYRCYFVPFTADSDALAMRLRDAQLDCYWGIWVGEVLAGFFMLRGFDEGYARPSFGVYIAQSYANRGLSQLALNYSLSWCRINDVSAIMLKVHPKNHFARRVYEKAGFSFAEVCARTGHHIMVKRWRPA